MAVAHKTTIAFSLVSTALYELAKQNGLEGIVSKRKDSLYYFGKRTHDWIKAKNLSDDDFVICGYIRKGKAVPFPSTPKGNEQAIWLKPYLVGTIKYIEKTASSSLRQPVFKGLRNDKTPEDCIV